MTAVTEDHRRTDIKKPQAILAGLDAEAYGLAGRFKRRSSVVAGLLQTAASIDRQSQVWKGDSDEDLRAALAGFKEIFRRRKPGHENVLPLALGAVREAAHRTLGLLPYPVQLAGALALYRGNVAEMATGEGKTLTAGLAAVLWGWMGRPCHVITVNDYLAERDAKRLAPLYHFCGLSVGCVTGEMEAAARREGHLNDVAYTTSKEILADFLRDRLWLDTFQSSIRRQIWALVGHMPEMEKGMVMRGIHSAIVDEADSVLIDEAVTPLIISRARPNEPFVEACQAASKIASELKPGLDYRVDEQFKDVALMPGLEERLVENANLLPELYRGPGRRKELIEQALIAKEFFHRDSQYVIQDGKVVIVDEFTGRLMRQRTWRAGLHQIIEAKENVPISSPSETLARLSFQRFFRFFHRLSGMTGTAREAAGELWHIYGLPVLSLPENRPCVRKVFPRSIFTDQESKWLAIAGEVAAMHGEGRPVLVGTRTVKASEALALRLGEMNVPCRVLNAVRNKEESEIIAHAGEREMVTVATNMAGRGTDIRLGGNVAPLGGLHVIATECHESARIDRQLFGRSARQGDPGSARSFVSLDDELFCRYIPAPIRKALSRAMEQKRRGSLWAADQAVHRAQSKAQGIAAHSRRSVLQTDTWLEDSLSFAQSQGDVG